MDMLDIRNVAPESAEKEGKVIDLKGVDVAASVDSKTVNTLSDSIALVATLSDPSRPDKTMRKKT